MELIKIYERTQDYFRSTLVETGGIQQLHEGRDKMKTNAASSRNHSPFRILMRNRKWNFEERESRRKRKIEEQIGREKESFSPNFFSLKEQLLEIESLKFSPPSSEKSSTRFFPRRRIILHLRGREEEKKRRCFDKQQSHLFSLFCIYERFVR